MTLEIFGNFAFKLGLAIGQAERLATSVVNCGEHCLSPSLAGDAAELALAMRSLYTHYMSLTEALKRQIGDESAGHCPRPTAYGFRLPEVSSP